MHRRDALCLIVTGVFTSSWPKVSLAGQGAGSHRKTGIVRVTRGPSDLVAPADGGGFRYGLGIPFQVTPRQAGLICNLRTEGFPVGDFEAGADLILFDRLDRISSGKTIPITRTSKYADRHSGEWRVAIKHWVAGGFVPFGARRPDGTPYLCGNRLGHERDWLLLWPLKQNRSGLEEPITVRNALKQFGPPPSGKVWFMDHPMSQTVRLADGAWRHLLVYRIMDRGEHSGFPPAPQTGLYVEEVISAGSAIPSWNFQ